MYQRNYDDNNLFLKAKCIKDLLSLLQRVFGNKKIAFGISDEDILELANDIIDQSGFMDDIIQFAKNDPAAKGSCEYVYKAYKGIQAMMYYRIARMILKWDTLKNVDKTMVNVLVRDLCEEGKVETGIDIHPSAQIGKGCVIDHGIGTRIASDYYDGNTVVIGETAIIGNNCTILNNVVIGAADVNKGQSEGRRHPKIGNNVTICAGVKILGKIEVGDNVFIAPGCRIVHDIPANTKVLIVNQLQIMKRKDKSSAILDGLVCDGKNLLLYGENIKNIDILIVDSQYNERTDMQIVIVEKTDFYITFNIEKTDLIVSMDSFKNNYLKILNNTEYYYVSSNVIERFLNRL